MRLTNLFFVLTYLSIGCGTSTMQSQETSQKLPGDQKVEQSTAQHEDGASTTSSGTWEKLVMIPFKDAQGVVTVEMPFPASWKILASHAVGEPGIIGPNGLKVIDFQFQSFMYTNDPQMQQTYYRSGQQLRPMPSVEQLIQQDIAPWCTSKGLTYVKHYEVQEVSRIDQWYSDQLFKAMPCEVRNMAIGTEWKTQKGDPFFMLIHLNVRNDATLQQWSYWGSGLQVEAAHFEKAKKQYIFSLANAHYNPQPIMAYNQKEAQKANQSWAAHNQRMAQNQANFEAQQRAFVNRSNATNDAIMSGWRERNAASDKNQEQFLDVINERSNVVNQSTGQQFKVESGSNQYWMNNNGEYFGTNNSTYDPNLDDNMNQQNWQQLQKVD